LTHCTYIAVYQEKFVHSLQWPDRGDAPPYSRNILNFFHFHAKSFIQANSAIMPGKDHVIGVIFFFVVVGLILFHIRRSWGMFFWFS
jgi:hypothetical protein